MNKQKVLNILKSHEWKEEESQVSFHIEEHTKSCYLETKKAYKKKLFSACIYFVDNYYGYEWVPKDDAKKALEWAVEKYKKDKKYFWKKYEKFVKTSLEIKNIFLKVHSRGLKNYTNKELRKLFIKIFELYKRQYGYSIISEVLDILSEQDYLNFLPGIKNDKALEIIRILSNLEELSFAEKEKFGLYKIAKKHFKNIKNASKDIEKHRDNYFWIQNNFRGAVYLNNKFFFSSLKELIKSKSLQEIKEEIKRLSNKKRLALKEKKDIYKKYKISKKAKIFFELVRFFALFQDERKENVQKMVYSIDQIFNEINKRFNVSKSDLDYYLIKEVVELLEKGKKVPEKEINKRSKSAIFSYIERDKIKSEYFFGKKTDFILNFFKKKRRELVSLGLIKGFVASIGKGEKIVKGKARIVFNPTKDTFKEGEILVSGMTRPEFVPLMKKSKAVITNEGGITTHAAIVSRELKIPCIIGTKIATDVIKNGDWVQLDLEKGVIKVIKK